MVKLISLILIKLLNNKFKKKQEYPKILLSCLKCNSNFFNQLFFNA